MIVYIIIYVVILFIADAISNGLREIIEPEYGLLEQLEYTQVIRSDKVEYIRQGETVYHKVDRLLPAINNKVADDNFIEALTATNQQHVANFISQKGGIIKCHNDLYLFAYCNLVI